MSDIQLREERLVMARMLLSHIMDLMEAWQGRDFDVSVLLIGLAVFIGTAEGRPFSTYKLAQYLKLPRSTVARKIRELQERGVIEITNGKVCIPLAALNDPIIVGSARQRLALFDATCRLLSKMGRRAIDV